MQIIEYIEIETPDDSEKPLRCGFHACPYSIVVPAGEYDHRGKETEFDKFSEILIFLQTNFCLVIIYNNFIFDKKFGR